MMWLTISSTIVFYLMFGLLLFFLWRLAQNLKLYAEAWLTLITVQKQNAEAAQKAADAAYILAKRLEKP